jgi:outer membrane protein
VREARANLKAAQAALLLQEQEVIEDVWNSYYDFRTAAGQLDASEAFLASALESYEASSARYRAGVGDIVELLNAQSLLAQARAQKVQATTSVFTSYAELVHSIGAEIPEPKNSDSSKSNDKVEGTSSDKQ